MPMQEDPPQKFGFHRPQFQTACIAPFVNREAHSTCNVLTGNKILDNSRDLALLVDVDQRFESHGRWEGCECFKDFGTGRDVEIASFGVDSHSLVRCGGIDEVG